MQSPAKPYGCRGFVTATKHIGLESFRVRNCDPGTNDRSPIERASQSWNDDRELDCHGQSTGLCASSWLFVLPHDSVRRSPSVDGVEPQNGDETRFADAMPGNGPGPCGSARHRLLNRWSSRTQADFGPADTRCEVHPFGLVCASGRIAPFFDMSTPFLSRSVPVMTPFADDASLPGLRRSTRIFGADACSQNGLRAHSLLRVSDEKRNADECPPTGGKSNRHR